MNSFKNTEIWKIAFESQQDNVHKELAEKLIQTFDSIRINVKVLVSEISIDLPEFTVHDIDHLDALWGVASQIVGKGFKINPVEGFILGCGFLFHDSAMTMAAYPGGIAEITSTNEWKRISNRIKAVSDERVDKAYLIREFLREQHAYRAASLPKVSWPTEMGEAYLIDDAEIRAKFGEIIGQIAASHWWDHSTLEDRFSQSLIPAPSPFPSEWSIDLLKVASILRVSDVSQIDERRAPSLLRAMRRHRLSAYSNMHWTFQNKLTQPQRRGDALYFASLRPFPKEEWSEWWMLHDVLKYIDAELRATDGVLARSRGDASRFAVRRVANIESPRELAVCVPTSGWKPIDTAFSIADIPRLVENLGGSQLYGKRNFVAVREALQNGMDAVRLRSIVDPMAPPPQVNLEIVNGEEESSITFRDNGIGMSEAEVVNNLLSFGTSGWLSDAAIGEFSEVFPNKSSVSGRYGIGFFSIFMLGDRVELRSRRFDSGAEKTIELSFPEGLNARPILSLADKSARMTSGGTTLILQPNSDVRQMGGSYRSDENFFLPSNDSEFENLCMAVGKEFPTSDVPIRVIYNEMEVLIDGRDWVSEPSESFLKRVEGKNYWGAEGAEIEEALALITEFDGTVVGRAALCPAEYKSRRRDWREDTGGSVVCKGCRVGTGQFRGVLIGTPARAARDCAVPIASESAMQRWASRQANLLAATLVSPEDQIEVASLVVRLNGDVSKLKVCEIGGEYLNLEELNARLRNQEEIWIAQDAAVHLARNKYERSSEQHTVTEDFGGSTIAVDSGWTSFIRYPFESGLVYPPKFGRTLRELVAELVCKNFEIDPAVSEKWRSVESGQSVYSEKVPVAKSREGEAIYVRGEYYRRKMKLEDVDEYYVKKEFRE